MLAVPVIPGMKSEEEKTFADASRRSIKRPSDLVLDIDSSPERV